MPPIGPRPLRYHNPSVVIIDDQIVQEEDSSHALKDEPQENLSPRESMEMGDNLVFSFEE